MLGSYRNGNSGGCHLCLRSSSGSLLKVMRTVLSVGCKASKKEQTNSFARVWVDKRAGENEATMPWFIFQPCRQVTVRLPSHLPS